MSQEQHTVVEEEVAHPDTEVFKKLVEIAGSDSEKTRSVYEAIAAGFSIALKRQIERAVCEMNMEINEQ